MGHRIVSCLDMAAPVGPPVEVVRRVLGLCIKADAVFPESTDLAEYEQRIVSWIRGRFTRMCMLLYFPWDNGQAFERALWNICLKDQAELMWRLVGFVYVYCRGKFDRLLF